MSKKVALVHDWLTGYRGGEKCLSAFLELYPEADIYTLIHVPGKTTSAIDARVKQTSFLQRFPSVHKYYRLLLPLYPFAIRNFSFQGYDLIISLSHAAAKNIRVPKESTHVCYCFTPMRYAWDQARFYFGKLTTLLWPILLLLRVWDRRGSRGVTHFIAISNFVAARIRCFYKRSASVIYPPVETSWISVAEEQKGEAFLWAGALVPYKRADVVVKTCTKYNVPLWVVGSGPLEDELKRIAGPSVKFFGRLSDEELARCYRRCKALVFPAIEDFGMIPVECMAAGRPVIALDAGGSKETVNGLRFWKNDSKAGVTGVFIQKSEADNVDALYKAMSVVDGLDIATDDCVKQAKRFDEKRFVSDWNNFLNAKGL